MVVSSNAVWKRTWSLPQGMEFPPGTEGRIEVTDRAGAQLGTYEGEVNDDGNKVRWLVEPADLADIPAGANYEMFINVPDDDHGEMKVEYGRVVRREAAFPAAPVSSSVYDAATYTDNVGTRSSLGPLWVQKYGKTVMHDNTLFSKPYGMGNDFILWDRSATHWYAPLRTDNQSVQVSLMKIGGGQLTVVLCSNYTMTNWIGVKFDCTANTVRPVTGSTAGPTTVINQGSTTANTVSGSPDTYTIKYTHPTKTIALYKGSTLTPTFTWTDSTDVCMHGEGHRYIGVIYIGSLLTAGPEVSYWSAQDDL
jgi:hypothetical protein